MPVNIRYLADGSKRYEARLSKKGPGFCRRFNTPEEARAKLAEWKSLTVRKEYAGRRVNSHAYDVDIKGLWDFFTLGVVK